MNAVSYSCNIGVVLLVCLSQLKQTGLAERPEPLLRTSISNNGEVLLIPVSLGSEQYTFVLDTGFPSTAVDWRLRTRLGPAIGQLLFESPTGPTPIETYNSAELRIGKSSFRSSYSLICMDLSHFPYASSKPVNGILGADFLMSYIVHLDFDDGELSLWNRDVDSAMFNGERLPLTEVDGQLYVDAEIGSGNCVQMCITTGHPGNGDIPESVFRAMREHCEVSNCLDALNVGGRQELPAMARVSDFRVGPFMHHNMAFSSGSSSLQLSYLSRYDVTLDAPRGIVALEPNKTFSLPDHSDMDGFRLHRFKIIQVAAGSYAEALGVRKGDRLLSVNGIEVSEANRPLIASRLQMCHEDFRLCLLRDSALIDVVLKRPREPKMTEK